MAQIAAVRSPRHGESRSMPETELVTAEPKAHVQLVQMATAYWTSRLLYAAAKLRLADLLANGPQNAESLAASTGTHAGALYRLMRTLAGLGLLTENEVRQFALTPLGEALKSDAPGSARATVLTLAGGGG